MRMIMPAAVAMALLLAAAPALADPARGADASEGLVPEQAGAPPAEAAAFAPGAPKDGAAGEIVHVVRSVHNVTGGSLPEPASWGLMIIGFGGMGAVLRGQRRAVAAALRRGQSS